jgi:hypothetical protein
VKDPETVDRWISERRRDEPDQAKVSKPAANA